MHKAKNYRNLILGCCMTGIAMFLAFFFLYHSYIQDIIYEERLNQMEEITRQMFQNLEDVIDSNWDRLAYHECLEQYADSVPTDLTVFLMDINGLKGVNDALGHEAGDELICGAAQCISPRRWGIGGKSSASVGMSSWCWVK